ncbi:MAG: hypothetical protein KDC14_13650, partial [Planctomycetes bacterium]|nr:hypothetical protein [Planctomycetota bacterium]
ALDSAVTNEPRRDRERLVVADSKKVYTRNRRGRARLESTVLAFLAQRAGGAPTTGNELVRDAPRAFAPLDADLDRHPWYASLPTQLPQWADEGLLRLHTGRLSRALESAGVRLLHAAPRVVPAGELNRSYSHTRNKSKTVWNLLAAMLRFVWDEHGPAQPLVRVDRQGGRAHYAAPLLATFPEADIECLEESDGRSAYRLHARDRALEVSFVERAEDGSLPVALASCIAKYARETVMGSFNSWFEALQPGLSPTAGYTTDGRRWLDEAGPALARAGIPRDLLIRER